MSVLRSNDGKELLISCMCGCDTGIKFKVDKEDFDYYCILTYINSDFYSQQDKKVLRIFKDKIKKIWAVICNKDYCYSELILNKKDFEEFQNYINTIK